MKPSLGTLAAALAAAVAIGGGAFAQQSPPKESKKADQWRPRDSTANLPSDSGSHTTLPSGAVTGAGHPQGRTRQPDVGSPGGLEPRAREEAREVMRGTGSSAASGGGAGGLDTTGNANRKPDGADASIR
jgi:hypothetical protein